MTEAFLLVQTLIWLVAIFLFVLSRSASIYHPFTFYLAFHGLVFVLRPIAERIFGFENVYFLMRFYPTDEQFWLALAATTLALIAFAIAGWAVQPAVPRLGRPAPERFSSLDWRAYGVLVFLLGPIGVYSALTTAVSSTADYMGTGDAAIQFSRDTATGITTFASSNGYFFSAQLCLGTLCLMLIWGTRFRAWSFLPMAAFLFYRAFIGWGRWTIVLTLASLALLFLYHRKRRWLPLLLVILAIPVLVIFQTLGENRDFLKAGITGYQEESASLLTERSWIEKQDGPDFASLDFLTYVMDVVPEKTGSYTYFTQYLQLLTEPIPRALWPSKPLGSPISLVNLNEYGNFIGWTLSLVGDGWVSGGWLGVVVTMAFSGLAAGAIHRWFWRGDATNYKVLTYCIFVPLTLQWYRDGGISIAKFLLVTVGPVMLWRFLHHLLRWLAVVSGAPGRRRTATLRPAGVGGAPAPPASHA